MPVRAGNFGGVATTYSPKLCVFDKSGGGSVRQPDAIGGVEVTEVTGYGESTFPSAGCGRFRNGSNSFPTTPTLAVRRMGEGARRRLVNAAPLAE